MIISIRNKALKKFWENNEASKLPADRIQKIAMILDRLEAAVRPEDMDLPGLRFHRLIGEQKGRFAVSVTANWRITFAWQDQDALDVDFEDYH